MLNKVRLFKSYHNNQSRKRDVFLLESGASYYFLQFTLKEILSYLLYGSGAYTVPFGFDGFAYLKFHNPKDTKIQ